MYVKEEADKSQELPYIARTKLQTPENQTQASNYRRDVSRSLVPPSQCGKRIVWGYVIQWKPGRRGGANVSHGKEGRGSREFFPCEVGERS